MLPDFLFWEEISWCWNNKTTVIKSVYKQDWLFNLDLLPKGPFHQTLKIIADVPNPYFSSGINEGFIWMWWVLVINRIVVLSSLIIACADLLRDVLDLCLHNAYRPGPEGNNDFVDQISEDQILMWLMLRCSAFNAKLFSSRSFLSRLIT